MAHGRESWAGNGRARCLNAPQWRGSQQPTANFDYSAPLSEAVLLGCLASAFPNESLIWDAPALKIPNNATADKLLIRLRDSAFGREQRVLTSSKH